MQIEILALRHQLVVCQRTAGRPPIRPADRILWAWFSRHKDHVKDFVAVDFFVVPTIRNQVFFVFLLLAHDRRRVIHSNVTANPTAEWTARPIVEVFPWQDPPRYLLRDRDKIYGQGPSRPDDPAGV